MIIFNNIGYVFAADLSNNWDFSTPTDYQADSGIEISGNNVHLKSQEYSPDGNTSALYHLNKQADHQLMIVLQIITTEQQLIRQAGMLAG